MEKVSQLVILPVIFVLISSCVTYGKDFDVNVDKIIIDQTNKVKIGNWYGIPVEQGSDSGREFWRYVYIKFCVFAPVYRKELVIYFKEDNTVSRYNLSKTSSKTKKNNGA